METTKTKKRGGSYVNSLLGKFDPDMSLVNLEYTIDFITSLFKEKKKFVSWHYIKILKDDICRNTIRHLLDEKMEGCPLNTLVNIIALGLPLEPKICPVCKEKYYKIGGKVCSWECKSVNQSQKIKNKWDTGEFHHQDKIAAVAPDNARKYTASLSPEERHRQAVNRGKNSWKYLKAEGGERLQESLKNIVNVHITHPEVRKVRAENLAKVNRDMNDYRSVHNKMTINEEKLYKILVVLFPEVVFNSNKFFSFVREDGARVKYIPDFLIDSKKLIVEADGNYHDNRKEYDNKRDEYFKSIGYTTIRIRNSDIDSEFVKETLKEYLND